VELLNLFRRQAPVLTAQLCDSPLSSPESRARIAHTLRGSALAVGARRVASTARRLEELAAGSGDQRAAETHAIASVQSAVAEALAQIDRIRA
jgi:HPt (histidine-containing phosphotransfer) domain-containing protein